MNELIIKNAKVVTPSGILYNSGIRITGGSISEIGPGLEVAGRGGYVVDAGGRYLAPAFIELHSHGAGGHDFMDGTPEAFLGAARTHAAHGTATILPTTVTCPDEDLDRAFEAYLDARKIQQGAREGNKNKERYGSALNIGASMLGLHLEGPYFSAAQAGAQDTRYLRDPDKGHYMGILEKYGKYISRWSIAPELPGALELGSVLKGMGIMVSVGHTDAFHEQVEKAYDYGYTHLTHFYSGMSGLRRINGMRRAGAIESAYIDDRLTVEIIADGMHLPQPLLKMIYRNIGPDRIILVTDSMRAAGTGVTRSLIGSLKHGQEVVIEGGVAWMPDKTCFAGSIATMDALVRNMINLAGASLSEALRMASENPARVAGFSSKGMIREGMDGDAVLFDDNINVSMTISGGHIIYKA